MQDVEFRLVVTRDKTAKGVLAAFERQILQSQKRVQEQRRRAEEQTNARILRQYRQHLRAEDKVRKEVVQRERQWLDGRLKNYQGFFRRIGNMASRTNSQPGARGGGGGGGGGRGGGFMGGATAAAMMGVGRLAGPLAALYGGQQAASFAFGSMDQFAQLQSLQFQLEALTGSAATAASTMEELKQLELISGIDRKELAQSVKTMNGFGISLDMSTEKLKEFAAIAGGDTQRLGRLALAFAQIGGNGRLMGEELNQMIDAGFNPLMSISQRTGKSVAALREEMRKGQISFEQVAQAITDVTSAGGKYGSMMESMQQSTQVQLNQMEAKWKEFSLLVGETMSDIITSQAVSGTSGALAGGATTVMRQLRAFFQIGPLRGQGFEDLVQYQTQRAMAGDTQVFRGFGAGDAVSRAKELDAQLTQQQERLAKIAEDRKKREESIEKAKRDQLRTEADMLAKARELNQERVKGAKEELKARQSVLEAQRKQFQEARQELMSARERFGGMSAEDQRRTVQTVLKARQGISNLSLDEISTLQNLGTIESNRLASQALLMRSRGGFGGGAGSALAALSGREQRLRDERAAIQRGAAGRTYLGTLSAGERQRLAEIDRMLNLDIVNERAGIMNQGGRRAAIRESLFASNARDVREERQRTARVEADVKQQIEFVARFENNAQQIAARVMQAFDMAQREQMDEVLKLLEPIRKQIDTLQRQRLAQQPGRGSRF